MQITSGFGAYVSLIQGGSKERDLVPTESGESTFDLGVSVGIDNLAGFITENKISPDDAVFYTEMLKAIYREGVSEVLAGEFGITHRFEETSDHIQERVLCNELIGYIKRIDMGVTIKKAGKYVLIFEKNAQNGLYDISSKEGDSEEKKIPSVTEGLIGKFVPLVNSAIITTKRVGEYSINYVKAFNDFFDTVLDSKINPPISAQNNDVIFE